MQCGSFAETKSSRSERGSSFKNTHRNLLTVNDHLKAIVQLWFAVTRFAQWLIVYMICLMRKLPSKTSF